MKTYNAKVTINASAEQVFKLLLDPAFAEKDAKLEGAVEARARIENDDGKNIVLVIEREEYERTPMGKNKNKREKSASIQNWDLETKHCRWENRIQGKEKLVEINGETWVHPQGDSCLLHETGNINIKIPIVGNIIAGIIASELEQEYPGKKGLIEGELKERS